MGPQRRAGLQGARSRARWQEGPHHLLPGLLVPGLLPGLLPFLLWLLLKQPSRSPDDVTGPRLGPDDVIHSPLRWLHLAAAAMYYTGGPRTSTGQGQGQGQGQDQGQD